MSITSTISVAVAFSSRTINEILRARHPERKQLTSRLDKLSRIIKQKVKIRTAHLYRLLRGPFGFTWNFNFNVHASLTKSFNLTLDRFTVLLRTNARKANIMKGDFRHFFFIFRCITEPINFVSCSSMALT